MKVLYHYTAMYHLPSILEDGHLRLAESNLKDHRKTGFDAEAYNAGTWPLYKPVVWMTEADEPSAEKMGLYSAVDKTEVKITIKKQAWFKKWKDWSKANNINREWAQQMFGGYDSHMWWISELVVTMDCIVKIENRYTGEIYYQNESLINKL